MTKVTLNSVGNLIDSTTAQTTINADLATISTAFDNTLSRDGTSPNTMAASLDMNSNRILNLPTALTVSEPVTLGTFNSISTAAGNLPAGGSTGQILAKASNVDYNANWITGLPIGNVTGLGTGVSSFLVTPSSANLAAALTDETGSGANVFAVSPALTGTPTAPTAAVDTNTTQLATTAMVVAQASGTLPLIDGTAAIGTTTRFARADHVHPTDTTRQAADAQLFSNIPQVSKSVAYTTVLTDGEKHIFHPSADTTARIWTIDSNANVPYPIGTTITFVNQNAGGVITIAITSDTMRLAGPGTTGSRSLAANGIATALKVTATEWIISGTGLT